MFESQNVKERLIETVNQSSDRSSSFLFELKREAVEDQRARKHHLKSSF